MCSLPSSPHLLLIPLCLVRAMDYHTPSTPVPRLRRACCLRCAKSQARTPGRKCSRPWPESVKCARCASLHKLCEPIPFSAFELTNELLRLSDRVSRATRRGDDDADDLKTLLDRAQKEYTPRVEALVRSTAIARETGLLTECLLRGILDGITETNRLLSAMQVRRHLGEPFAC